MTQKDPNSRLSVAEYLDILQGKGSDMGNWGTDTNTPPPPPVPVPAAATAAQSPSNNSAPAAAAAFPPPPPSTSTATTATATVVDPSLSIFPSYFNSSLYPLYLKLQSYFEVLRSITGGVEDAVGGNYFAVALGSAKLNTSQDSRNLNTNIVLAADPTATTKKQSAVGAIGAAGAAGVPPLPPTGARTVRSSTTQELDGAGDGAWGGGSKSNNPAQAIGATALRMARERSMELADKSTSKYFKELLAGGGGSGGSGSGRGEGGKEDKENKEDSSPLQMDGMADFSTEELVRMSELLIEEVEREYRSGGVIGSSATKTGGNNRIGQHSKESKSTGSSGWSLSAQAERLMQSSLKEAPAATKVNDAGTGAHCGRFGEEDILCSPTASVSASIVAATSNLEATVSWGGVTTAAQCAQEDSNKNAARAQR